MEIPVASNVYVYSGFFRFSLRVSELQFLYNSYGNVTVDCLRIQIVDVFHDLPKK